MACLNVHWLLVFLSSLTLSLHTISTEGESDKAGFCSVVGPSSEGECSTSNGVVTETKQKIGSINDQAYPCNIDRIPLPQGVIEGSFLGSNLEPVIFVLPRWWNSDFAKKVQKAQMIEAFGNTEVELASSNSFSHDRIKMSFARYINEIMPAQGTSSRSNETFYLFGGNLDVWDELLEDYQRPPCGTCGPRDAALSFGAGGAGSGVAFHTHGPGFSETLVGRKRWFLYPPEHPLDWDPDMTQQAWLEDVYPLLKEQQRPWECVIAPGEILYFPDEWMHATINLDVWTVFVSTFTLV